MIKTKINIHLQCDKFCSYKDHHFNGTPAVGDEIEIGDDVIGLDNGRYIVKRKTWIFNKYEKSYECHLWLELAYKYKQ